MLSKIIRHNGAKAVLHFSDIKLTDTFV